MIIREIVRKYNPNIPKYLLAGRDLNREYARIKANFTCQKCDQKWNPGERRFDCHHKKGCGKLTKRYDRLIDISNLIVLCHKCHLNEESVIKKMRFAYVINSNLIKKYKDNYFRFMDILTKEKSILKTAKILGISKQAVYSRMKTGEKNKWDEDYYDKKLSTFGTIDKR